MEHTESKKFKIINFILLIQFFINKRHIINGTVPLSPLQIGFLHLKYSSVSVV